MATAVSGEQRCGAGARLRAGRENGGLSVPQAAERLRFDARIVEALEAEDYAALGA
ncbi:MAG: helix-turn-helix domain-containing protein, partial [Gammaproteobacteria bacterium]